MKSALAWGQCLFYALDKWHTEGGRPNFRRSEHWPIAHVQHTGNASELRHFVPPGKLKSPVHGLLGFYGEVLHHDMTPCRPMSILGIVVSFFLGFCGSVLWAVKTIVCKLWKALR